MGKNRRALIKQQARKGVEKSSGKSNSVNKCVWGKNIGGGNKVRQHGCMPWLLTEACTHLELGSVRVVEAEVEESASDAVWLEGERKCSVKDGLFAPPPPADVVDEVEFKGVTCTCGVEENTREEGEEVVDDEAADPCNKEAGALAVLNAGLGNTTLTGRRAKG